MAGNELLQAWDRQKGESTIWFTRFDAYYRPQGPGRSLLRAYKDFVLAERDRDPDTIRSAPGSWTNAFTRYNWKERAEAWDVEQRRLLRIEEEADRRRNRQRRKAVLNLGLSVTLTALNDSAITNKAKLSEVASLLRVAVQELRKEYDDEAEDRMTADQSEYEGAAAADPYAMVGNLSEAELDLLISNLQAPED